MLKLKDPDMELYRSLSQILEPARVLCSEADRISYSRDLWPLGTIGIQHGEMPHHPDFIVWPQNTDEVSGILRLAKEKRVPVIPFGGGSGVCGGTLPLKGGMIIDCKRMSKILRIDEISLTVSAESGIIGEHLERELNRKGYTAGHFPSSMYCSTLGGWLATRSAGQLSARYGKIEDMVVNLQVVLPGGEILETKATPRSSTGPDFNQIFVGSEGTLGIITRATIKIHHYPKSRRFSGFLFKNVPAGLEAIRKILQKGVRPATVRLYDELDTLIVASGKVKTTSASHQDKKEKGKLSSFIPEMVKRAERTALAHPSIIDKLSGLLPESCLLILTFEGAEEITEVEQRVAVGICEAEGGQAQGPEPGERWWKERYKVSYSMSTVFALDSFVDTIEVATTWDRLERLYFKMREAISKYSLVMAHFSHAYQEGCSIYFTFAASAKGKDKKKELYQKIWDTAMDVCVKEGATISHHHGIGYLKASWMQQEHGEAMKLYRAIKAAIDPENIMNPGKMGL
ncbi:MAG: FAD-binding oxidoreductase [Deltaproteobacteria bacterium]|nr:MAG: FAD-binding oxidoreductase [Deltaproteobacteria bacterium]